MNEAQEEMVPRLPVGRDHPYDGPLQYRLSDACGNEREPDNDWTERCHDRRGFHTSQAVAAGYDVRKGREGPQYRQCPCYIRVYAALSDTTIPAHMDFDTKDWTQAAMTATGIITASWSRELSPPVCSRR